MSLFLKKQRYLENRIKNQGTLFTLAEIKMNCRYSKKVKSEYSHRYNACAHAHAPAHTTERSKRVNSALVLTKLAYNKSIPDLPEINYLAWVSLQISKLFNISFLSKRLYGGSLVFIFWKQSSPWNSLDFNKNSSERSPRNSTKFLNLCKLSSFFFKISVTLTKYTRLYLNNFTSLNSNNTQIKLISSKYYATWPLLFSTEVVYVQIQLFGIFLPVESILICKNNMLLICLSRNWDFSNCCPWILELAVSFLTKTQKLAF